MLENSNKMWFWGRNYLKIKLFDDMIFIGMK